MRGSVESSLRLEKRVRLSGRLQAFNPRGADDRVGQARDHQYAENTSDNYSKGYDLASVAELYIKLDDAGSAARLLELAFNSAKKISDNVTRNIIITKVIQIAPKLSKIKLAHDAALLQNSNDSIVKALALVLTTWANRNNPSTDDDRE
jgi:hypothetical protein